MKKVLVPLALDQTLEVAGERNFARSSYIRKLVQYDLFPLFVSPYFTPEMIEGAIAETSGVLFMGGADFDASTYGESNHPKAQVAKPPRDALELSLLKRFLGERRPLLAICRGCQGLAIASGGSLYQHLPDIVTDEIHDLGVSGYDAAVFSLLHDVILEPGSRIQEMVGREVVRANSTHHQAVRAVGPDLLISGRSPAGIVEVIEHRDPSFFCFGIQSHPEVFEESLFEPVFKAFTEEVQRY